MSLRLFIVLSSLKLSFVHCLFMIFSKFLEDFLKYSFYCML